MPGKLTLYPTAGPSRCFILAEGREHLAGRAPGSDVLLEDSGASARHAVLRRSERGWRVSDLGSKNGTFVNGVRGEDLEVAHEDWLSFGGLLAHFEQVSEDHARQLAARRTERLHTSAELRRELLDLDPKDLLRRLVESSIALAGAQRGFVLLFDSEGGLHAEVASGAEPFEPEAERFAGSLGAIERALETRRPVVASDAKSDAFLGKRRSVIELGIGALACVPLSTDGRVIGLIYVDGRREGGAFTDLDLEILETLGEHAALVLAGVEIRQRIRELSAGAPAGAPGAGPSWIEELGRRLGEAARRAAGVAADPNPA